MYLLDIDLNGITKIEEFQFVLREKLNFPEFYGMNWDAFWDSITELVYSLEKITFYGWVEFKKRFPKDSLILKGYFKELSSCIASYI